MSTKPSLSRGDLAGAMRAAYGRRAVEVGVPERGNDRVDAAGTIANVLHWVHQQGIADPESVLETALHGFVIERAGAYGWERVRAVNIEDGEWIAPDENDRPDGEGRRVAEVATLGLENLRFTYESARAEDDEFRFDDLVWRKVEQAHRN